MSSFHSTRGHGTVVASVSTPLPTRALIACLFASLTLLLASLFSACKSQSPTSNPPPSPATETEVPIGGSSQDISSALEPLDLSALSELVLEVPLNIKLKGSNHERALEGEFIGKGSRFRGLLAVLVCRDVGAPLPGWRQVEDRAREVDAVGRRLVPSPAPDRPASAYVPEEDEIGVVSKEDLSPLFAEAFPELGKLIDDPSVDVAMPLEYHTYNDFDNSSVDAEHRDFTLWWSKLVRPESAQRYLATLISAKRGTWSLNFFATRDSPPQSIQLASPTIRQYRRHRWFADFQRVETDFTSLLSPSLLPVSGHFVHAITKEGAPLAGHVELWAIPSKAIVYWSKSPEDPDSVDPRELEEAKAEAEREKQPGYVEPARQISIKNCMKATLFQQHDGTFQALVSDGFIEGEDGWPDDYIPIEWWPRPKLDLERIAGALWVFCASGGVPLESESKVVASLERLRKAASNGALSRDSDLHPLSMVRLYDTDREVELAAIAHFQGVFNERPALGRGLFPIHSPKIVDGRLEFGAVNVSGTMITIELESIANVEGLDHNDIRPIPLILESEFRGDRPELADDHTSFSDVSFSLLPSQSKRILLSGRVESAKVRQRYFPHDWYEWNSDHLSRVRPEQSVYGHTLWESRDAMPADLSMRVPVISEAVRELQVMYDGELYEGVVSTTFIRTAHSRDYPTFTLVRDWRFRDIVLGNPSICHPFDAFSPDVSELEFGGDLEDESGTNSDSGKRSMYLGVPKRSLAVCGYWVIVEAVGFHPEIVYCDLDKRGPLVVNLSKSRYVTINLSAPDSIGRDDATPAEIGDLGQAAAKVGWNGRYHVFIEATKVSDGSPITSLLTIIGAGQNRQVSLQLPVGVPLKLRVVSAGIGFDIGRDQPEFTTEFTVKPWSANEETDEAEAPDLKVTIPLPTFVLPFKRHPSPYGHTRPEPDPSEYDRILELRCDGALVDSDIYGINQFGVMFPISAYRTNSYTLLGDEWYVYRGSAFGHPVRLVRLGLDVPVARTIVTNDAGEQSIGLSANLPTTLSLILNTSPGVQEVEVYIQDLQGRYTDSLLVPASARTVSLWAPPGEYFLDIQGGLDTAIFPYDFALPRRKITIPRSGALSLTIEVKPPKRDKD